MNTAPPLAEAKNVVDSLTDELINKLVNAQAELEQVDIRLTKLTSRLLGEEPEVDAAPVPTTHAGGALGQLMLVIQGSQKFIDRITISVTRLEKL